MTVMHAKGYRLDRREGVRIIEWHLKAGETGQSVDTAGRPTTVQAAGEFRGARLHWETALTDVAPFEPVPNRQGLPFAWSRRRVAGLETSVGLLRPRLSGGDAETEVVIWAQIAQ